MKTRLSGMARWLALAVFALAAGCCYSCGLGGQTVGLSHAETMRAEAETVSGAEHTAEAETVSGAERTTEAETEPGAETVAESAAPGCFVHVCGEVASPGVYELREGQRVFEAVELAGGFTADAAESYLNLAEPVWDGMKIQVPDKSTVPEDLLNGIQAGADAAGNAEMPGGTGDRGGTISAKININTATKEELMTLRGIGEARAEDIVRYRQNRGGFDRIEDIMEVSGIKDAAFQKIKNDITV